MNINKKTVRSGFAVAAVAALALTACSPAQTEDTEDAAETSSGETITIGIKYDQPGLGYREGSNAPTGFDVDVARAIAAEMGYEEEDIEWAEAETPQRENLLENGQVDMIVASYGITDERAERVDFAGPYFMAGQDILVTVDNDEITGPEDLDGRDLCSVTGSTPAQFVRDNYSDDVNLVEQNGYAECLTFLESGQIDAVTTDDVLLAGLAAADEHAGKFKVVGNPFTEEPYGVGLPPNSGETCEQVNAAIQTLLDEGTVDELLATNMEGAEYEANEELNTDLVLETCGS